MRNRLKPRIYLDYVRMEDFNRKIVFEKDDVWGESKFGLQVYYLGMSITYMCICETAMELQPMNAAPQYNLFI